MRQPSDTRTCRWNGPAAALITCTERDWFLLSWWRSKMLNNGARAEDQRLEENATVGSGSRVDTSYLPSSPLAPPPPQVNRGIRSQVMVYSDTEYFFFLGLWLVVRLPYNWGIRSCELLSQVVFTLLFPPFAGCLRSLPFTWALVSWAALYQSVCMYFFCFGCFVCLGHHWDCQLLS